MAPPPRPRKAEIPAPLRDQLNNAREALLVIHKALLEEERIGYERGHGRIENSYQLLQLVISDPWFAWLHPLSELVVQIDVLMESREPAAPRAGEALVRQTGVLLHPTAEGAEFSQRYHRALQESPAVVLAHAEALTLLGEPG